MMVERERERDIVNERDMGHILWTGMATRQNMLLALPNREASTLVPQKMTDIKSLEDINLTNF